MEHEILTLEFSAELGRKLVERHGASRTGDNPYWTLPTGGKAEFTGPKCFIEATAEQMIMIAARLAAIETGPWQKQAEPNHP